MERSRGVLFYAIALMIYGAYNLLGALNYGQFADMLKGIPQPLLMLVYVFIVFYSICCVYCGSKILRLEDWARRFMVVLSAASVILGVVINPMVMRNFREFLASDSAGITPEMAGPVFRYIVALTFIFTLFEISVIYFFTRPRVAAQFEN
jgi:hypothetical protein